MKITIRAKPSSHRQKIEKIGDGEYAVWVKEPPAKGLANMAIKNALADHFKMPHSKVRLVSGYSSRTKVFEI